MDWWAWVLLVVLVVLVLIMASMVRFTIYYSRIKDNDRFYVHIKALFGLVRYKLEIPVIKFKGIKAGVDVKAEQVNAMSGNLLSEQMTNIDQEKIVRYYRKFKEILQATFEMKEWLLDTMAHVTVTSFKWDTRVGVGDAPETAITTGIVWTLKSSILGYLFKFVCRDTKPIVRVMPQYNQNHFSTELVCEAQIRVIQSMMSGIYLLRRVLKVKGGLKRWQNVLTKSKAVNEG